MKPNRAKQLRRTLLAMLATLIASAPVVHASRLAVTPTRINLAGQGAATLTLRNRSAESVLVQTRVVAWSQEAGSDQYQPTKEVLVSPPIVEIPSNADRIVRIAFLGERSPDREQTFRLILSEVVPEASADPTVAIRFAIEFNLPVFVLPSRAVKPELDWDIEPLAGGDWRLHASNQGTAHAQVRAITLTCENGDEELVIASMHRTRYVLSGSSVSWPIVIGEVPCKAEASKAYTVSRVSGVVSDRGHLPAKELEGAVGRVTEVISVDSRPAEQRLENLSLRVRAVTDYGPSEGALTVTPAAVVADLETAKF